MRVGVPGQAGAVLDAAVERPVAYLAEAVASREAVRRSAVEHRQFLRVAEDDSLLLPSFQREDTHLEGRAIQPLEQGGVFHLGDDLLIDGPALVALDHATLVEVAVDV